MNAEQYAKAKELFFDLVDKPIQMREDRLRDLEREDPEIAREVRLLVANHNSRTIVGPTVHSGGTRSNSKSVVSQRLRRIHHWFVGGLLPISIAILASLIIVVLGWYLRDEMKRRAESEYRNVLDSLSSEKMKRILRWSESHQLRIADWGSEPKLQQLVKQLDRICHDTTNDRERSEKLRAAEAQREIKCVFDRIASRPLRVESLAKKATEQSAGELKLKYAIWNSNFQLLADWQWSTNDKIVLGEVASMTGKSILSRVFETKATHVVLPRPTDETISKDYPLEVKDQYVMFFVPVFEPNQASDDPAEPPQIIGAMMVRSPSFIEELRSILNEAVIPDGRCYLVDSNGVITSDVPDLEKLQTNAQWREMQIIRKQEIVYCVDPGGDILSGFKVEDDPVNWPRTIAARGLALKRSGENVLGYRDYRGIDVVGAWKWMDDIDMGLVLEVPKSIAFRNLDFVSRAFLGLLAIPVACAVTLIAASLLRKLRDVEFTNRTVGPYRLMKQIGEGGLGVVFRAMHKSLQRPAAVKLIKPGIISPNTMRRFEREVRLASSFEHPNAVHIYDFGVSKDGFVYCAMQLVDGATLSQIMSFAGYLPMARTLHFLKQIATTLSEAHHFGLVHRDIKPQNVMVCRSNPKDSIKVVDFGLAKNIVSSISRDATATRVLMGTPGFIAPERLESPWIADPRIDTFSFGVLGIYLLTGKIPSLGISRASLIDTISPLPISRELVSDRFQELVDLLLACASTTPDSRPDSMHEVSLTLERVSQDYRWTLEDAERWWHENGSTLSRFLEKSHEDKKNRTARQ